MSESITYSGLASTSSGPWVLTIDINEIIVFLITVLNQNKVEPRRAKKASTIQYDNKKNVELMHECFPKHLHMGTARVKEDEETEGEGKQKNVDTVWKEVQRARNRKN